MFCTKFFKDIIYNYFIRLEASCFFSVYDSKSDIKFVSQKIMTENLYIVSIFSNYIKSFILVL